MAKKRFTDIDKWDDPFYMELPNKYKLFWQLILDKCDNAGIYKVNLKLAEFLIKDQLDYAECVHILDGRIREVSKEKWFIPKFIDFQYGELSEECRPHLQVISLLKKEGLYGNNRKIKGIHRVSATLQDKDKDKDKDNKGVVKDKYGDFVLLTQAEHTTLTDKLGVERLAALIDTMNNGIAAKGYKYKSHYHALLNWAKREPETEVKKPKYIPKPDKNCDICKGTGKIKEGDHKGYECICVK